MSSLYDPNNPSGNAPTGGTLPAYGSTTNANPTSSWTGAPAYGELQVATNTPWTMGNPSPGGLASGGAFNLSVGNPNNQQAIKRPLSGAPSGYTMAPPTAGPLPVAGAGSNQLGGTTPSNGWNIGIPTNPPDKLVDMSGKQYAGVTIPDGWSMKNGQFVFTGATGPKQNMDYPEVDFMHPTRYIQGPDGKVWDRTDPSSPYYLSQMDSRFTNLPNGIQRSTPLQLPPDMQNSGGGSQPMQNSVNSGPPVNSGGAGQMQSNSDGLLQYLQGLFGNQQSQMLTNPQYGVSTTPLGYTQYQPPAQTQGTDSNSLMSIISLLMNGMGQNNGATRQSFWDLGSSTPYSNYTY